MRIIIDVAILYLVMITVTNDLRFRFLDFALWAFLMMLITGFVVSFAIGMFPEETPNALLVAVGSVIDTLAVLGLLWFKFQIDNAAPFAQDHLPLSAAVVERDAGRTPAP